MSTSTHHPLRLIHPDHIFYSAVAATGLLAYAGYGLLVVFAFRGGR